VEVVRADDAVLTLGVIVAAVAAEEGTLAELTCVGVVGATEILLGAWLARVGQATTVAVGQEDAPVGRGALAVFRAQDAATMQLTLDELAVVVLVVDARRPRLDALAALPGDTQLLPPDLQAEVLALAVHGAPAGLSATGDAAAQEGAVAVHVTGLLLRHAGVALVGQAQAIPIGRQQAGRSLGAELATRAVSSTGPRAGPRGPRVLVLSGAGRGRGGQRNRRHRQAPH